MSVASGGYLTLMALKISPPLATSTLVNNNYSVKWRWLVVIFINSVDKTKFHKHNTAVSLESKPFIEIFNIVFICFSMYIQQESFIG